MKKSPEEMRQIAARIVETRGSHQLAREMIEWQKPRTPGQWRTICTMKLMQYFGWTEDQARPMLQEMDGSLAAKTVFCPF